MKNDSADVIPNPFNLMLNSLKSVNGYKDFCNFIKRRLGSNEDWRAEIKALFEINKNTHPLVSICSQNKSEPEGVFRTGDKDGIIEAAFVRYLFDRNFEKSKTINRIQNSLKPLCKYLIDKYHDYAIKLCLFSLENKPTENELKTIKSDLIEFFTKKGENLLRINKWGLVGISPKNNFPSIDIPNPEIILSFQKGGIIIQSYNTNLNEKVLSLIKNKRKQHKTKFKTFLKLYYFYIDCPITKLREIVDDDIQRKIHDDEVLVVNATSIVNSKLVETKRIFGMQKDLFDFSNPYYINTVYKN
jgi:hypothetical protein